MASSCGGKGIAHDPADWAVFQDHAVGVAAGPTVYIRIGFGVRLRLHGSLETMAVVALSPRMDMSSAFRPANALSAIHRACLPVPGIEEAFRGAFEAGLMSIEALDAFAIQRPGPRPDMVGTCDRPYEPIKTQDQLDSFLVAPLLLEILGFRSE